MLWATQRTFAEILGPRRAAGMPDMLSGDVCRQSVDYVSLSQLRVSESFCSGRPL
jgi:hypothetical protein